MTYGTCYFVTLGAAIRYYRMQGEDENAVGRKLDEGLIHIGKPTVPPGAKLMVMGGRYVIEEV